MSKAQELHWSRRLSYSHQETCSASTNKRETHHPPLFDRTRDYRGPSACNNLTKRVQRHVEDAQFYGMDPAGFSVRKHVATYVNSEPFSPAKFYKWHTKQRGVVQVRIVHKGLYGHLKLWTFTSTWSVTPDAKYRYSVEFSHDSLLHFRRYEFTRIGFIDEEISEKVPGKESEYIARERCGVHKYVQTATLELKIEKLIIASEIQHYRNLVEEPKIELYDFVPGLAQLLEMYLDRRHHMVPKGDSPDSHAEKSETDLDVNKLHRDFMQMILPSKEKLDFQNWLDEHYDRVYGEHQDDDDVESLPKLESDEQEKSKNSCMQKLFSCCF